VKPYKNRSPTGSASPQTTCLPWNGVLSFRTQNRTAVGNTQLSYFYVNDWSILIQTPAIPDPDGRRCSAMPHPWNSSTEGFIKPGWKAVTQLHELRKRTPNFGTLSSGDYKQPPHFRILSQPADIGLRISNLGVVIRYSYMVQRRYFTALTAGVKSDEQSSLRRREHSEVY